MGRLAVLDPDDRTILICAAGKADVMGLLGHAAGRARDGGACYELLVGPSLVSPGAGYLGFWMCHVELLRSFLRISGTIYSGPLRTGLRRATAFSTVPVAPAPIAQSETSFPAQRIFRKIGQNQFSQPWDKIHLSIVPVLLVLGIAGASLAAMNEMAVLRNRTGEREGIETTDALESEAVFDMDMNGHFRSLSADRTRDVNGPVSQREIRKRLGIDKHIDRVLGDPADVRNTVHMVLEFTNG
jgi:hypothetical protein